MNDDNPALERHFRVAEVAKLLGVSRQTTIRIFTDYPGVLKLEGPSITGRKKYTVLSIPESVLKRFHEQWSRGFTLAVEPRRRLVK